MEGEKAVSPVVGVMLMLVVTIIIAAVVSAYSGGLMGNSNNMKTPTLAMEVRIVNSTTSNLSFYATVLSISDPIPTSKLKLTTSWVKNASLYGGATTTTGAPYGFGPGVSGEIAYNGSYPTNQMFGNYTLTQGTGLIAESDSAMTKIFGNQYSNLGFGDVVTVRMIYTPTGKALFQKDVVISGA